MARKIASRINRHRLKRSRKRVQSQSTIESFCEPYIGNDRVFCFSPYEATRRYLEREAASSTRNFTWRPFFDWPGQRCLQLPMMAMQRRYPARFWELRIPKLPWPIEFLLPMTRLTLPSANIADNVDVGDKVKLTEVVQSGVVNIYLVGARGLRSIPVVEKIAGLDEKGVSGVAGGGKGNVAIGSIVGGADDLSSSMGSNASASMETRAATLVALNLAAKTFTIQPSPQIMFSYGEEEKSSQVR